MDLDQVLRSILPDELEVPGAFEAVGHIGKPFMECMRDKVTYQSGLFTAHLNLRDQYLPFKHIIGEVLLDVSTGKPRESSSCL